MAVTAQLASISTERAREAATNEASLNSLISFEMQDDDAFSDFDWSEQYLVWSLLALNRLEDAASVNHAFQGSQILNSKFPSGTSAYEVYSEIKIHAPHAVQELSIKLRSLPVEAMANTLRQVRAAHPGRELPNDYEAYVSQFVSSLIAFYERAALKKQSVVTWSD